jgi:hypothetical protein
VERRNGIWQVTHLLSRVAQVITALAVLLEIASRNT